MNYLIVGFAIGRSCRETNGRKERFAAETAPGKSNLRMSKDGAEP